MRQCVDESVCGCIICILISTLWVASSIIQISDGKVNFRHAYIRRIHYYESQFETSTDRKIKELQSETLRCYYYSSSSFSSRIHIYFICFALLIHFHFSRCKHSTRDKQFNRIKKSKTKIKTINFQGKLDWETEKHTHTHFLFIDNNWTIKN